jgi:hypothetical protein
VPVTRGQGGVAPSAGAIVLPAPGPPATAALPLQEYMHAAWARVLIGSYLGCLSPPSSRFDAPASRHQEVAKMVVEQAKRLVESRHDVAILLESITRLGRASSVEFPARGQALSGGAERLLSARMQVQEALTQQIHPSCRARS